MKKKVQRKRITARRADRRALLVGGMKSVENQVDSCSSATQDCNASEFVDGDQADSEDVTVVDGVTFINGVAVSDTNHEKKGGVDVAQKPKQKQQKSEIQCFAS